MSISSSHLVVVDSSFTPLVLVLVFPLVLLLVLLLGNTTFLERTIRNEVPNLATPIALPLLALAKESFTSHQSSHILHVHYGMFKLIIT